MKYLTLEEFCTCSKTYQKHAVDIDPYPSQQESVDAIASLMTHLVDPIIEHFGRERFILTYGFCSIDLKKFLEKKDDYGVKNGRVCPRVDQHMAHEVNRRGKYYCDRLGAACDFRILDVKSNVLVQWIQQTGLHFDSIYYYGDNRPIHLSYGPQHKRHLWKATKL